MKKLNLLSLIIIFISFFVASNSLLANYKGEEKDKGKKPALQKITADPRQSLININNVTMWVTEEGFHDWVVASGWNGAFPNGSSIGAIFAEGVVWGGQVNDGSSPVVRVNGNTYGTGCAPLIRLFRVRPDYLTGDLSSDAATFNNIPIGQVSEADMQALRDQYAKDWLEWPAKGNADSKYGDQGAPFEDIDGDGLYDPSIDIPGIPGASQSIFIKYSDELSESNYGSIPIGLEISETYWAYAYSGALGNVIYKQMTMVYKGTPQSSTNATIDSMFIVQWADPDVGNSTDDYAGCDTTLNLGYAYTAGSGDATYAGLGLPSPAVGYDFFSGVSKFTGNPDDSAVVDLQWKKGYKYINRKPMSSYIYFAAGGNWSDPGFNYNGTLEFYNLMRGYLPIPRYPSASPFPTNVADVTPDGTYLLAGDPSLPPSPTNKIDGVSEAKGDRRIMCVNGPITMSLGDTAQIVLGIVYGMGQDNLGSVSALKQNDNTAQIVFDQLFQLPSLKPPVVKAAALDNEVVLSWGSDINSISEIENFANQNYSFQGYEVYQVPSPSSSLSEGILLGTWDIIDGITSIYDDNPDANGTLIPTLVANGTDKGIIRYLTITQDQIRKTELRNGQEYYFAVVAYAYNPSPLLPFHTIRSPFVIQRVTPQQQMGYTFKDQIGNSQNVSHSDGLADASVSATIIDPTSTTGDIYQVFFTQQQEIRNANGDWIPASLVRRLYNPNNPDTLTGSSIDIAAVYGVKAGQLQLNFFLDLVSVDYDYSDGISLTFPAGVTILDAPPFEAGNGSIVPEIINYGDSTVVIMGDITHPYTGDGPFGGGEEWSFSILGNVPFTVKWQIYDDGYGGGPVDETGETTVSAVGNLSRLAKYWNLSDLTSGTIKLQNQSSISGIDMFPRRDDLPTTTLGIAANPIVDGVQVIVNGSWDAPTSFSEINPPLVNGNEMTAASPQWATTNFRLTDFIYFGYSDGTANASLSAYFDGSSGTTDVSQLQQDIELRWTGILGDTVLASGDTLKITKSGGSFITLAGASLYSIAAHPLNPNPGSTSPFTIRVPFEIWNVDTDQKITAIMWDRSGNPTANKGAVWNTLDREYIWVVNTPNSTTPLDPVSATVAQHATWNLVIYKSTFNIGDVMRINYDNPLLPGVDLFTFSSNGSVYSTDIVKSQVDMVNVFPNPYYGYQYRELAPNNKYVTFSHLPDNAVIRIFDLSGVLVKTIHHVSTQGQFESWDLANDNNYPVASGIYIVYIDMPDLGTTKILKLAIIQEQQMLKTY